MIRQRWALVFIQLLILCAAMPSGAQDANAQGEDFLTKEEDKLSREPILETPAKSAPEPAQKGQIKVKELADLSQLAPFKDVAVIQKRFLPKTKRFEVYGAGGLALNDAFFTDMAANLRFGYYFRERYGLELTTLFINSSNRQVTTDLQSRHVQTQSLVSPHGFYGLDFKYTPVYGKMTYLNRGITPFDLYFSLGFGQTNTGNANSPTLHLGTGQIFARTKSFALRWDFSWNFYYANSTTTDSAGNATQGATGSYNNLFILLGASFFFPGATYR